MNQTIVEHLANLKFYSKFKRNEKAKSFDQFVEYIDSGASDDFQWIPEGTKVYDEFKFDDPFYGDLADSETEEAIDQFLKQKGREEPIPNLDDWYNQVEYHIDYLLKRYEVKKIKKENHFKVLNEILVDYPLVKKYIQISDDDFYTYTSHMQNKLPEDFLTVFSENKKIEDYPLINCFPRIFINCKSYAFFQELKKEIENPKADYTFIFNKMQEDKLIHFYCKDDYTAFINLDSTDTIELYPESKVKRSKFKNKYQQIHQKMY